MKRKVLSILLLMIMLFSLSGCLKKTPIDTDNFITNATSFNYTIQDNTNEFSNEVGVIKSTLALSTNGYQIEFYEFKDTESSKKMFNINKTNFEFLKSSKYSESTTNAMNYNTYSLSTDSDYMYTSRVDKTLIYLKVNISNKDEVKEFIDKLGY